MYMRKSLSLTLSFVAVAVVAMIASLCFLFLGNEVIDVVPKGLNVENVEGEYILVADYNSQYRYQFKIEQLIDGKFSLVSTVNSVDNAISLSKEPVSVIAGEKYRFSVCYATENGAGNGDFSQAIEWCPEWHLQTINYAKVKFDKETAVLSWDRVHLAESYVVNFVDLNGNVKTKISYENNVNVSAYDVGVYKAFIVAKSSNAKLFDSSAGEGVEVVLQKKNQINEVVLGNDGKLEIVCSQDVRTFQVFVDDELVAELQGKGTAVGGGYAYEFVSLNVVFANVDFASNVVEICSLNNGYVLQSDLVEIQKN